MKQRRGFYLLCSMHRARKYRNSILGMHPIKRVRGTCASPHGYINGGRRFVTCFGKRWNFARLRWTANFGPILKGHDIHHVDTNTLNDALENYECLTKSDHRKRHLSLQS